MGDVEDRKRSAEEEKEDAETSSEKVEEGSSEKKKARKEDDGPLPAGWEKRMSRSKGKKDEMKTDLMNYRTSLALVSLGNGARVFSISIPSPTPFPSH